MDKAYDIRKLGGDKLALLGLFAVGLLIAHLIVVWKSALVLSEPIKLPHTDLSVSMPAGNGWESEGQWKYRENAFSLISTFARGTNKPIAWAQCRYLLAAETTRPQLRFEKQAYEVDGEIVKTDQTKIDTLTFDWALIEKPQTVLGFIFGTANLPNNRQLDIEVHQVMGDFEMAERAFKSILKSLTLKDNRLLEAGAQIIAQVKSRGLDSFLNNQKRKAFFLIKDSTNRTIGFTMDVLFDSGRSTRQNIQAVGLFYIRDRYVLEEQVMSFQGTNNFDEFTWKSETSTRTSRSGTEIILDEAGPMTIRKFGPEPLDKNYLISPAAIPNIFIEQIFSQMLEGGQNEIIVDIIEANGKIIPILISRIEDQKDFTTTEEAAYRLRLEFLDGRGFFEQVYLNDRKQTYKMLLQQRGTYIFESTTVEEILTQFPERAEYILQTNEISK